MSLRPHIITHAERARRREVIRKEIEAGADLPVLAERFGITVRYVRQIAQDAGLAHPTGRPRIWRECPEHLIPDYDFMIRRKHIPAAEARRILEGQPA